MKHRLIKGNNAKELIIFFSGWGTDERIFSNIELYNNNYDICLVWDYNDPITELLFTSDYTKINIIAWSLGVWSASEFIKNNSIKINKAVAINGTLLPISDNHGIPELIYNGTCESLSEDSIYKFYRRMCGSKINTEYFISNHKPDREINSLKNELITISEKFDCSVINKSIIWNKVVISKNDNIFPTKNQIAFWQEYKNTNIIDIQEIDNAHYFSDLSDINELIKFL